MDLLVQGRRAHHPTTRGGATLCRAPPAFCNDWGRLARALQYINEIRWTSPACVLDVMRVRSAVTRYMRMRAA